MRRLWAALIAVALLAPACTSESPLALPATSPPAPRPSPSATPSPAQPEFDASRAVATIRVLAAGIGPREAVTAAYTRAADYLAGRFGKLGYRVTRQSVPVPAGAIEGVPVRSGTSDNVIAVPPGFDPAEPHLIAGAHLDSVPLSPGANDNASGAAVLLELARIARLSPTRLPVVWVAFTAEERRFKGSHGGLFGSRYYFDHLPAAERRAIVAMLNVDMVGNGPVVLVCHNGKTTRPFLDAVLRAAKRLDIPARENVVTKFFSDHLPFELGGVPVSWLWTGEHPTVHTARDTPGVIRPADLARVGRVAWESLRDYSA